MGLTRHWQCCHGVVLGFHSKAETDFQMTVELENGEKTRMSKQNCKMMIFRFDTYFFCLAVSIIDVTPMLFGCWVFLDGKNIIKNSELRLFFQGKEIRCCTALLYFVWKWGVLICESP